jgi:hypothetical protein
MIRIPIVPFFWCAVYFYMLYLTMEYDDIGLNILTFLPQLIIILALVYRNRSLFS